MTQDTPTTVWNEVRVTSDGISISMYSESRDSGAVVEDELWFTFDELQAMSPSEPKQMRLSQSSRKLLEDAASAMQKQEVMEELEESEPSYEEGEVVQDTNAPSWSEDDRLVVVNVADHPADEYIVEARRHRPNETVYTTNPSCDADETVIEAVYYDDWVHSDAEGYGEYNEDDVYAFPESRIKSL